MQLHAYKAGSGPPLIIIHGLFGLSDNWVTIGRRLATQFRVIVPDLRNHGRSPHSDLFDFPSMEEDLLELMDELEIDDAAIMGHSLGGRIAVQLALHYPERVNKLIIADISLRKYPPRSEHLELIQAMKQLDLDAIHTRQKAEKELTSLVSSHRLRQFLLKNLYHPSRERLAWRLNLDVINESLPALFDTADLRGTYEGPALFVRGGQSDYIRAADIPAIKKQFPRSIVRTIEGASHWVHADKPEEFYQMVHSFLENQ
jgi:esterase